MARVKASRFPQNDLISGRGALNLLHDFHFSGSTGKRNFLKVKSLLRFSYRLHLQM
jgi:hypothetical protein